MKAKLSFESRVEVLVTLAIAAWFTLALASMVGEWGWVAPATVTLI